MSLRLLKAGILDSIQDSGRFGYRRLGINPTGVMDNFAAAIANTLTGNKPDEAVVEMHFPAPVFLFDQPAIIALAGADFNATINGESVPVNHPLIINKSTVLQFQGVKKNARCYLAVKGGFKLKKWLGSFSTNLKAEAGGINGSKLKKDDSLELNDKSDYSKILIENDFKILPWSAHEYRNETEDEKILVLPGNEWDWLDAASQETFISQSFSISSNSDRMGYRLNGVPLQSTIKDELISSAVCFGAIQLLPDGQMIILMADHQTTGGYPRPGFIISAHLHRLAQLKAGDKIKFSFTTQKKAEEFLLAQQLHLLQLQNACTFRLENYIHENS